MRKNLVTALGVLALMFAVFFVFSPLEKVHASETVTPEGFEGTVEDYNLEDVEFTDGQAVEGDLEFETIAELEVFLAAEQENELNKITFPIAEPNHQVNMDGSSTKTYKFSEYTGVSKITSYAKVTRSSRGYVTKVVVWSSQTGIAFPISYIQNMTDYNLNSTEKGGKAYVYGTKSYGVTVGGQGIAYKRNVTYTVPF